MLLPADPAIAAVLLRHVGKALVDAANEIGKLPPTTRVPDPSTAETVPHETRDNVVVPTGDNVVDLPQKRTKAAPRQTTPPSSMTPEPLPPVPDTSNATNTSNATDASSTSVGAEEPQGESCSEKPTNDPPKTYASKLDLSGEKGFETFGQRVMEKIQAMAAAESRRTGLDALGAAKAAKKRAADVIEARWSTRRLADVPEDQRLAALQAVEALDEGEEPEDE